MRLAYSAALLAAFISGGASAATLHVSPSGSNAASGGPMTPVQTIARAIELGGTVVLLEHGEYVNETGLVIPAGVTVRGGHTRSGDRWVPASQPSIILNTALVGQASVTLLGVADAEASPARLEWVQVLGGTASVELRRGAELYEVELGGGTNSAIFINDGLAGRPSRVTRCIITGGQTGIRITGTGSAVIDQTKTLRTLGVGLDVRGTGQVTINRSVFQQSSLQGVLVSDNSNVTITNSVFRRNLSDGLRIFRSNASVVGSFFELNENGIVLQDGALNAVENNTIVNSRQTGIVVVRSTPNILRNVIAYNSAYGVREERPEIIPGQPEPLPTTNSFVDNVLFLNDQGPYFDEGIETLETEAQLNGSQLRNRQPSSGNRIADPLFVSFGTGNYRLRPGSPAIDKAVYTGSLLVDQQGNPRAVGIPGTGINAPNAIDAGAFEYQGENVIIDGLGVGYYDESATTDPDEPGRVLTIRRHPIWEFNPSNPFRSMRGWVLPGRMRVTPFQDESVAFAWRRANDIAQPQGKVARVRATVESRAETNRMTFRLRANWNDRFDSAKILVIDGPQAFAAPPGGREYSMLVDLAQGDYANLQPGQLAPIPYLFNMDTIDFGVAFPSPSVDLTNLQVDLLDRDALVSEFTQIAQRWTFATGTEGWEFQPPPPGYGSPIARHSAPRQALEMAQLQFFSYGTWAAPIVDLAPGTDFLIQFRVSSDRPRETSTSFRVRASDFTFMTTQELVITASANGEATPVPAGRVYTVFGTVCPLADVSGLRFFWDLYGFDGETRGGSLFLEEVTILTKPTN